MPSFATRGAVLPVALSPPVVHWARGELRGHMLQHLLPRVFALFLWVMAALLTLFLTSVPDPTARRPVRVLHSRPARAVSHRWLR